MGKVWLVVDPDWLPVCGFNDDAGKESAEKFCEELKEVGLFGGYSEYDVSRFYVIGVDLYGDDVVQAVSDVVAKEEARYEAEFDQEEGIFE